MVTKGLTAPKPTMTVNPITIMPSIQDDENPDPDLAPTEIRVGSACWSSVRARRGGSSPSVFTVKNMYRISPPWCLHTGVQGADQRVEVSLYFRPDHTRKRLRASGLYQ